MGSHFEKSHYGNELMTSQSTGNFVLSRLSLAFLEDTGWYKVDYSTANSFEWGKDQGCGFLDAKCNTVYPEFCQT